MSTYTVSTNEYTDARTLAGIANILERGMGAKEVMPLDEEQVSALIVVVEAVSHALPTHWCRSAELINLYNKLKNLAEMVSMEAVATALKEQEPTSDKKGL